MADAAYYRAQAELCFSIARSLSDTAAAERTRAIGDDYVQRAEKIENDDGDQYAKKN
jgi:hypothetical protein